MCYTKNKYLDLKGFFVCNTGSLRFIFGNKGFFKMICRRAASEKETAAIAVKLAGILRPGDVVCLTGDLGAGKTTFTKSLGRALGVEEDITSPTFSLIQEYRGRTPVYHFDVYRLSKPSEFLDIGAEEYFNSEGICVIEWAEMVRQYLPNELIWVEINWVDADQRDICISGKGELSERILKELDVT
jgi:tRNA threonylcarbamoyladenosine biosynthesis protein TsaE